MKTWQCGFCGMEYAGEPTGSTTCINRGGFGYCWPKVRTAEDAVDDAWERNR